VWTLLRKVTPRREAFGRAMPIRPRNENLAAQRKFGRATKIQPRNAAVGLPRLILRISLP
jgi:hypothetical protein